jgi:Mg-chelatase subunit ChlD
MEWATRRKLQYTSIIIAVIVIFFVIPFYAFIYKAPTCFDGFKNAEETGIDCGGACKLLCSAQIAEPISRWDPRVFKVTTGVYSVVAYLENQNVTAEVLSAPYKFSLYDKDNVLITTREGTTFIPRGQNFAIFEGNIQVGERIPTRASFEFGKDLVWLKNTDPKPDLTITSKALSNENVSPRVDASVKNNTLSRVSNIELVVMILDSTGNAIGASRTFIESLEKDQIEQVVFTWPQPFATKSVACSSPVDVALVIDRSGSMASLGKTPPQPLTDVKNAAILFVNQLTKNDQATVISFANEASSPIDSLLTSDTASIISAINNISIHATGTQNTNIADGMLKARDELNSTRHKNNADKVMITLTDGVATRPEKKGDATYPETEAIAVANNSKIEDINMFTIGLGKEINTEFLESIASTTDDFYLAPTTKELTAIYKQIATKICQQQPAVIQIIPRVYPNSVTQ